MMKRYLFFLLSITTLFYTRPIFAQAALSGGLRLQVQAPVVHWLQFGQGSGAEVWIALPLSTNNSLEFSLGYLHLSGYDNGLVTINEITAPLEYWRTTENLELNGMTFFSAAISHEYQLTTDSRWSVGTGIRFSRLIRSEGYQKSYEQYRVYRISTYPSADLLNVDINQNYQARFYNGFASTLNEEQLNLYDLGLTIALRYRLIKGLVAEASIYQGLLNRWSDNYNDLKALYITSFSLGLSARIF
jgi:hypothetical protein